MRRWVSASNDQELGVIQVYDVCEVRGKFLNNLTFDAMMQYFGRSNPLMMYCAWRVAKLAIAKLWLEEIPYRKDIRVSTAFPMGGC